MLLIKLFIDNIKTSPIISHHFIVTFLKPALTQPLSMADTSSLLGHFNKVHIHHTEYSYLPTSKLFTTLSFNRLHILYVFSWRNMIIIPKCFVKIAAVAIS